MTIAWRMVLKVYRYILNTFIKYLLLSLLATVLVTLPFRWFSPPMTSFMIQRVFMAWLHDNKTYQLRYEWKNWRRISPYMSLAVIASEDQRFLQHSGFDLVEMADAFQDHLDGKRMRGASTVSQQVAKNLYLWPGQNFMRKGIEAYFTVLIETLWSKRRIMEIYLNSAEFGRGIFGVEAAAQYYFRNSAENLTLEQAALLVAVLPNPHRLHVDKPSEYVRERQKKIILSMQQLGGLGFIKDLQ